MPFKTIKFTIATDGSGDFTETKDERHNNRLLFNVEWVDGDMADGVDYDIYVTNTPSGVDYLAYSSDDANDDSMDYPRAPTKDLTGALDGGSEHPIIEGKLKLVVSSGGASKAGACFVRLLIL